MTEASSATTVVSYKSGRHVVAFFFGSRTCLVRSILVPPVSPQRPTELGGRNFLSDLSCSFRVLVLSCNQALASWCRHESLFSNLIQFNSIQLFGSVSAFTFWCTLARLSTTALSPSYHPPRCHGLISACGRVVVNEIDAVVRWRCRVSRRRPSLLSYRRRLPFACNKYLMSDPLAP